MSQAGRVRYGCAMYRSLPFAVTALLAWSAAFASFVSPAQAQVLEFELSELTVITAAGGRYPFKVELATSSRQRAQGLQHRRRLADAAGMLFDFGHSQPVAMWMKNTFVPLDMIFIAEGGRIVSIARDTVPFSLAIIESAGLVRGVLEVRAGTAARLGIESGDRVAHEIFE